MKLSFIDRYFFRYRRRGYTAYQNINQLLLRHILIITVLAKFHKLFLLDHSILTDKLINPLLNVFIHIGNL